MLKIAKGTTDPAVDCFKNLNVNPFLSKSLSPGVQEKRKKLGGRSAPTPWVLKSPESAGFFRVKK